MPETKGGSAERLKQQSFLLPQRLSSKEVIVKQLRGLAGPGVLLGGEEKKEGAAQRGGPGNVLQSPAGQVVMTPLVTRLRQVHPLVQVQGLKLLSIWTVRGSG